MDVRLITGACADADTECLVVVAVDYGEKYQNDLRLLNREAKLEQAASELLSTGELTSKTFEAVIVHHPQGLKARRLLVIHGGKAKKFNAGELRKAAGAAVRYLKPKMIKSCVFVPPEIQDGVEAAIRCVVEGALLADYDPDTYRKERRDLSMRELAILISGTQQGAAQRAADEARIVAESQNFARDLVNEPSNQLTPTSLAERARQMCEQAGLKCAIMGPDKIKELKMGAFLSVAQGSDEEPRLMVVRYEPDGAPEKPLLGLVGKGVTFDTGGISLKPADNMERMKYDMGGGAAMLGAIRALALLKLKVRAIAIVLATENMPSGKSFKPGDVFTAMSGKTIEVINTDAEGRLLLADGLYYARTLGCTHLLDAATLTGACVVALGMVNAGVFSNNEEIYQRFSQGLQRSGEKFWRLPLDPEYFDQIRSAIADVMNTSGRRYGGASNAAMFLNEFVDDTPWIHMDIAGVGWIEESKNWIAKGPSGIGVRTVVEFARSYST